MKTYLIDIGNGDRGFTHYIRAQTPADALYEAQRLVVACSDDECRVWSIKETVGHCRRSGRLVYGWLSGFISVLCLRTQF